MSSSSNWKIHDLGSSRKGFHHWWLQRITAVALLPLTMWLAFSLAGLPDAEAVTLLNWVSEPFNTVALLAFLMLAYYHGMLGLQVIIEDYVHPESLRIAVVVASQFVLLLSLLASLLAVLKLVFLA